MSEIVLEARQEQASGSMSLLVLLTITATTTFTGVVMLGPLLLQLATEFQTTVAIVGQLVAAGGLTWALLGPVCGALSDRYGRKPLLVAGLVAFGLVTILSSWATDLPTLFIGRMIACIGGAFVGPNVPNSVADAFPDEKRASALGWVMTGSSLAPVVGVPALAFVAGVFDWRWSFRLFGVTELILAVLVYRGVAGRRPLGGVGYGGSFGALLRSGSVLGLLSCNLFDRIAYGAITTYLAAFLMETYGLSVSQVAPIISLVAVSALPGTLFGGRLAGRVNPVAIFLVAEGIAALLSPPLLLLAPAVWLSGLFAASYGGSQAVSRAPYMYLVTQVAPRLRGSMMGLNVMINQLGLVLGAALGGMTMALGGYSSLALLTGGAGILSALCCRLVSLERLAKIGEEQVASEA